MTDQRVSDGIDRARTLIGRSRPLTIGAAVIIALIMARSPCPTGCPSASCSKARSTDL